MSHVECYYKLCKGGQMVVGFFGDLGFFFGPIRLISLHSVAILGLRWS